MAYKYKPKQAPFEERFKEWFLDLFEVEFQFCYNAVSFIFMFLFGSAIKLASITFQAETIFIQYFLMLFSMYLMFQLYTRLEGYFKLSGSIVIFGIAYSTLWGGYWITGVGFASLLVFIAYHIYLQREEVL